MAVELTASAKRKLSAAKAFKAQEKRDRASGRSKTSGGAVAKTKAAANKRTGRGRAAMETSRTINSLTRGD